MLPSYHKRKFSIYSDEYLLIALNASFCEKNGFPKIPQKVPPKKYPNGENFLSQYVFSGTFNQNLLERESFA